MRRHVPGPAGRLADKFEDLNIDPSQADEHQENENPPLTKGSIKLSRIFWKGPWLTAMEELDLKIEAQDEELFMMCNDDLFDLNLSNIPTKLYLKKLPQPITVLVEEFESSDLDPCILLRDCWGEMKGYFSRDVLAQLGDKLRAGCVLLLQECGVFGLNKSEVFLNVVAENILHCYPRSTPLPKNSKKKISEIKEKRKEENLSMKRKLRLPPLQVKKRKLNPPDDEKCTPNFGKAFMEQETEIDDIDTSDSSFSFKLPTPKKKPSQPVSKLSMKNPFKSKPNPFRGKSKKKVSFSPIKPGKGTKSPFKSQSSFSFSSFRNKGTSSFASNFKTRSGTQTEPFRMTQNIFKEGKVRPKPPPKKKFGKAAFGSGFKKPSAKVRGKVISTQNKFTSQNKFKTSQRNLVLLSAQNKFSQKKLSQNKFKSSSKNKFKFISSQNKFKQTAQPSFKTVIASNSVSLVYSSSYC